MASAALEIDLRLKRKSNIALTNNNLAAYRLALDQTELARTHARGGLRAAREAQIRPMIVIAAQHLALVAALRGDHERAARLAGYTDAAYKNSGNQREPTEQKSYDHLMATIGKQLREEAISALLDQGARWSEDEAIEEALRV